MVHIVVGTTNKAKIKAVEIVVNQIWPQEQHKIEGHSVESGVSAQPFSDEECIRGATNRARAALEKVNNEADFAIGLEGGIQQIGAAYFECGWIVIMSKDGRIGIGSSGRFLVAQHIIDELIGGKELAEVIDQLSGKTDVRSSWGMMGEITNGGLTRDIAYSHGVWFAFAPFISPRQYWVQDVNTNDK